MPKAIVQGRVYTFGSSVFFNRSGHKRRVAFGAPYPGKIIPIHLAEIGGELITQKDSFLAAAKGVSIGIAFQRKLGVGLFGGEGFIEYVGKIKSALFGGEGLFFATRRGPGRVWLQSLPLSRLANRIVAAVPGIARGGREEGSILRGLGGILDGDNS
jgi:uncharacterized protein (AIM24 family)